MLEERKRGLDRCAGISALAAVFAAGLLSGQMATAGSERIPEEVR